MEKWTRTSFSIKTEILHVLNKVPRSELPNKSLLVEILLCKWLKDRGYTISGSSEER